jgi:isoleucyl-tRNA synthetase
MRGMDLGVDPDGKFIRDVVRLNIKPLWSAFNFFTLYANADGVKAKHVTASENMLDRYILAKAKAAVLRIEASLDGYDTTGATEASTQFFDVLNNWYIRRSRSRFWAEEMSADKQAAYDTLYTVLNLLCLATAPLLPFTTEAVYRGLNGGETSVHLQDFPDVSAIADDGELVADMDWVQDVCNAASAIRNKLNIRTRQPLASLTLAGSTVLRFVNITPHIAGTFHGMIQEEVNVKAVNTGGSFEEYATVKLQINSAVLGKRLPEKMKQILPASKKGEWKQLSDGVEIAGEKLRAGEYTILLEPKPAFKDRAAPLSTNDALVLLDTTITPELEAEGRARDLVRMIQQARKDAGLHVADRITLGLDVPSEFKAALATHGDFIAAQTLAVSWAEGSANSTQQMKQELDGAEFIIGISRAA